MSASFITFFGLLCAAWTPCSARIIHTAPDLVITPIDDFPGGWYEVGCWSDDLRYPQLGGSAYQDDSLTIDSCVSWCDSKLYAFAGLKNGVYCYCGTDLKSKSVLLDDSQCSTLCPGDRDDEDDKEICGGPDSLSLYFNPYHQVYTNPGPEGSVSLGCFSEVHGISALDFKIPVEGGPLRMTVAKCVNECNIHGSSYAGLEQGTDCYCGDSIDDTAQPATEQYGCGYRCTGNASEWCGGVEHINLYELTDC
ncbi:WSC domain-containing protein [Xylaria digitata]|nr:WSC domain-containing protein [Xylaria digitata]